ncbi:DUF4829 domain-containing protein [Thermincola ferriacetica]
MKKTAILGLIFLLLISGCIGTNSSIEQYNKQYKNDDEQCKRAITDYFEAVKTHDLDRLKSLYSTERRKMAQNASLGEDEYEFINISQIVPDKSVVYEYMTFGHWFFLQCQYECGRKDTLSKIPCSGVFF